MGCVSVSGCVSGCVSVCVCVGLYSESQLRYFVLSKVEIARFFITVLTPRPLTLVVSA